MPETEKKTLEDQLLENAVSPKIADIDGQRIEQHSIDDQIKALKFAASVKAAKSKGLGIRIAKMEHGGSL